MNTKIFRKNSRSQEVLVQASHKTIGESLVQKNLEYELVQTTVLMCKDYDTNSLHLVFRGIYSCLKRKHLESLKLSRC